MVPLLMMIVLIFAKATAQKFIKLLPHADCMAPPRGFKRSKKPPPGMLMGLPGMLVAHSRILMAVRAYREMKVFGYRPLKLFTA